MIANIKSSYFEIIDFYGERHRYSRADGFSWAYGVVAGSVDTDDHNVVVVYKDEPDDETSSFEFLFPSAVGDVQENTSMSFGVGLRETSLLSKRVSAMAEFLHKENTALKKENQQLRQALAGLEKLAREALGGTL